MRLADIFFAAMVAVLWGGNFIAAKYGVAYFPPFFFSALRFACVAALMLPFVPRVSMAQLRRILPLSFLATFHFSLLFAALYHDLDIASSALIGQLGVPFSCILGALFLQDKIGPWRILGIVIAFIGIAIVAGSPNILAHQTGFFLALGSTFSWGLANILVKQVKDMGAMQLLAWMSFGTIPFLLMLSMIYEPNPWPLLLTPTFPSLIGLAYTVIASTVVAYGLWYYLLAKNTVSQVAPFSMLTPVFGIGFGQLFFNETLTMHVIVGGAITIVGVAIIVIRRPKLAILAEAT